MICHGCGKKVDDELLEKYITDKIIWSKVLPTCGREKCLVHKKVKWKNQMKRKVDKQWEHKNWMNRREFLFLWGGLNNFFKPTLMSFINLEVQNQKSLIKIMNLSRL